MSLYRTYRPKTFADVVGQDHIVSTLERAVEQGRLGHAYLFAGSRGTGKTSVARILAKTLITRGMTDDTLRRQVLDAIDDGSLVDLTEIDAASNRGIDDIRNLLEKIQFTPVAGSAKVYIIDEVHMLTREAFNALLKTLEEPPAHAFFILATTELFKIPPTIQSRCQRFLFQHIREEEIIRRLQYVADQEHITIDRGALRAIAHSGHGSMRDALSLLDQLRSLETITHDDVKSRVGETGHEYVEAMMTALEQQQRDVVLDIVRRMEEAAVPLDTFLRLLLGEIRNSLHADITAQRDTAPRLQTLDALLHAVRDVRMSPVPGLALETTLLSLCTSPQPTATPKPTPPPTQEPIVPATPAPPVAKQSEATPPPQPPVADTIEAPELTLENLRNAWPGITLLVLPPSVRMSLKDGQIVKIEGNILTLHFHSAFHRDKVATTEGSRAVEQALQSVFKTPVRIQCLVESDSAPTSDADVVNLADAAAEVF